jgi:hypothetical protein
MTASHHCYRLGYSCPYDSEAVWALVQRHGGWLSIRQDVIDFWLAPEYCVLLLTAFPLLTRRPDLDHV